MNLMKSWYEIRKHSYFFYIISLYKNPRIIPWLALIVVVGWTPLCSMWFYCYNWLLHCVGFVFQKPLLTGRVRFDPIVFVWIQGHNRTCNLINVGALAVIELVLVLGVIAQVVNHQFPFLGDFCPQSTFKIFILFRCPILVLFPCDVCPVLWTVDCNPELNI